jgi:DNA-binding MarR family transcriptional regulator
MATTKPRITVTLTESQHRVLRALSEYSGQSMSSYISEFLTAAEPTMERMAATFQRIRQANDQRRQQIVAQLEEAQAVFEPLAMSVIDQADLFLGRLEEAATGAPPVRDSARTERTGDAPAPSTNRGVTPLSPKPLKPAPRKASRSGHAVRKTLKKSGASA